MPRDIEKIKDDDKLYDELANKYEEAWMPLKNWLELHLDPDKTHAKSDEQLWFCFLCPDCLSKLKIFLNKKET